MLTIKLTEANSNSIRCNFCEGIGLYELYSDAGSTKDFVVVSYIKNGVSCPIDQNLVKEYNSKPNSFRYQIIS